MQNLVGLLYYCFLSRLQFVEKQIYYDIVVLPFLWYVTLFGIGDLLMTFQNTIDAFAQYYILAISYSFELWAVVVVIYKAYQSSNSDIK